MEVPDPAAQHIRWIAPSKRAAYLTLKKGGGEIRRTIKWLPGSGGTPRRCG
jgi:hypothetical protein